MQSLSVAATLASISTNKPLCAHKQPLAAHHQTFWRCPVDFRQMGRDRIGQALQQNQHFQGTDAAQIAQLAGNLEQACYDRSQSSRWLWYLHVHGTPASPTTLSTKIMRHM